jgi:hypothetical protein
MNNSRSTSYRTDDQLDCILCEVGNWVVSGRAGQVLCHAPSLRQAIDRASEYAASGAVVIALCRLPSDNIVVFADQMSRLRKIIAGRETPPLKDAAIGNGNDLEASGLLIA